MKTHWLPKRSNQSTRGLVMFTCAIRWGMVIQDGIRYILRIGAYFLHINRIFNMTYLAGPTRREWGSLNLYIGILGMKLPSFPTKGQLDICRFLLWKTTGFQSKLFKTYTKTTRKSCGATAFPTILCESQGDQVMTSQADTLHLQWINPIEIIFGLLSGLQAFKAFFSWPSLKLT